MEVLHIKISKLREIYEISQKELAKLLGISRTDLIYLQLKDEKVHINSRVLEPFLKVKSTLSPIILTPKTTTPKTVIPVSKKKNDGNVKVIVDVEKEQIEIVNKIIREFPESCKVNISNTLSPKQIIASRIIYLRESKHYTLEQVAKWFMTSPLKYKQLEAGLSKYYPPTVKKLSQIYHVPEIVFNERLIELEIKLIKDGGK